LWREVLREETPAIDDIGFNTNIDLASVYDDDTARSI
jgi:hypothetical protein